MTTATKTNADACTEILASNPVKTGSCAPEETNSNKHRYKQVIRETYTILAHPDCEPTMGMLLEHRMRQQKNYAPRRSSPLADPTGDIPDAYKIIPTSQSGLFAIMNTIYENDDIPGVDDDTTPVRFTSQKSPNSFVDCQPVPSNKYYRPGIVNRSISREDVSRIFIPRIRIPMIPLSTTNFSPRQQIRKK